MEINLLTVKNRTEFRSWLIKHAENEAECWIKVKRGKPKDSDTFYYIDAVEEALCFGWIDSKNKVIAGERMQRFSPRRKNSPWTELNKERVRRLERLGLMTTAGRRVLPDMDLKNFAIDPDIEAALKAGDCWVNFQEFPPLYQRIRAYNIAFYKKRDPKTYHKSLERLIDKTQKNQMYGEWNDYGRLLEE